MKINEQLIENGKKLYLDVDPSIFGTIKYEKEFYVIEFYYRNVFQNEYKKDSMSEAQVKLGVLIENGYKQYLEKENENNIIKFSDFLNEYQKYGLLPKELRSKNILYHSTDFDSFKKIMETNELYGAENYDSGVSTSRNKHYGFGRYQYGDRNYEVEVGHNAGEIQLLLDKDKIANNYKIDAFDWDEWKQTNKSDVSNYNDFHQAEDKIKTDIIKDIKKYIVGVHIVKTHPNQEKFDAWMKENDFDFQYIFDENWKDITKNYK